MHIVLKQGIVPYFTLYSVSEISSKVHLKLNILSSRPPIVVANLFGFVTLPKNGQKFCFL